MPTVKQKRKIKHNPMCIPCNPSTRLTRFSKMKRRNPEDLEISKLVDILYRKLIVDPRYFIRIVENNKIIVEDINDSSKVCEIEIKRREDLDRLFI